MLRFNLFVSLSLRGTERNRWGRFATHARQFSNSGIAPAEVVS